MSMDGLIGEIIKFIYIYESTQKKWLYEPVRVKAVGKGFRGSVGCMEGPDRAHLCNCHGKLQW